MAIMGLITGLLFAGFLTFFEFDKMFCDFISTIFKIKCNERVYYFIFAVVGLIGGMFNVNLFKFW
jgi:hypothetical protein